MDVLFPFDEPRKIQKAFIMQAMQVISSGQNFLVHAPTGIGKTAAALSPALTYALKNNKTVFFLTSRHTQHMIAIETLKKIKAKHDVKFNVVDLVGKQWMCNQSGVHNLTSYEFSEYCKDLRKKENCVFFKNLKYKNKISVHAQSALKVLENLGPVHVEKINEVAKQKNVCPYELACLMGKKANIVIADYFHIMHPNIRESLFKRMEKELENCIVVFDEAHNLPERARSLLTSKISTYIMDNAVKEARQFADDVMADNLIKINDILMEILKQKVAIDENEALVTKDEFLDEIYQICELDQLVGDLKNVADEVLETKKRSFIKSVADFLDTWPGPDEGFVRIISRDFDAKGKVAVTLSYKCLDPSFVMKPIIKTAFSTIVMSGTLTPMNMYKDLLGYKDEEIIMQEYDNPFPKENRLNLIIPETSTRFTTRSNEMFKNIADKCVSITNKVPGNCAVFFPSYNILEEVYYTMQNNAEKTLFVEQPGMSKEERAQMLDNFKQYKDLGAVLLGVSSGSFGEGIDLLGDLLKSVIIVGLPLSKPDLETKELIKYYDKKYGRGWDYAYIYPAIIKTMQNAGRCIRSHKDRGVIVFLDERYLWNKYFSCFPKSWEMQVAVNPETTITSFFGQNKP